MKRYIVCDDYSNYYKITDWCGLVNILIDNLHEDTLDNINEEEIVKLNYKTLETIAKGNFDFDFLQDNLRSYGWYIQDLTELQKDLSNFQAYIHGGGCPIIPNDCIEQTLKMIESEIK